ncbi:hypothetical protein D3C78_1609010 [compost metagenome]
MEAVLDERGTVPAAVFVERRAAVDPVLIPVTADDQAVARVQRHVVLPGHGIAVGVEHFADVAELVEGFFTVLAVAQFQA